jgi:uronate dehydrogenase
VTPVDAATPRRVLVTGSSGSVGSALCERLPAAGWTVRQLDRNAPASPVPSPHDAIQADASDPAVLDEAARDCCAIVHLAATPHEGDIEQVTASHIVGTARVLEAAERAGVRRVILASSNHAVGRTPRVALAGTDLRPRPDSYYGVGKVATEALGSLYADRFGMDIACLRIGSFLHQPTSRRHLSTWLSPDDLARLVDACLRANDLGFSVIYGISANTRAWWDLEPGRRIGYHPADDAEDYADAILSATPDQEASDPEVAFLGGAFAGPAHPVGVNP